MDTLLNILIILYLVLILIDLIVLFRKRKVKFIRLNNKTIIPSKRKGDAGYDIYANFEEENFIIQPHETKLVPTGLSTIFSNKYVLLLRERGSTGSRGMALRCGVIDSNYRGEIFVGITNTNDKPLIITKEKDISALEDDYIVYPYSKAIAQGIFLPLGGIIPTVGLVEDLDKNKTERNKGSLGSSNK